MGEPGTGIDAKRLSLSAEVGFSAMTPGNFKWRLLRYDRLLYNSNPTECVDAIYHTFDTSSVGDGSGLKDFATRH